ncbi:MAG: serine protease [Elusimicrobiales bacterium]|nr:serine protease [Elusimicrobiales bacterium]
MIKTIATLVLALAMVPANAANISFDTHGGSVLPAITSIDIPARPALVPEGVNPFDRFGAEKIVGGVQATKGEFPFLVSLRSSYGSHFCGGSLIKKNWVLTAAHCVEGGYLKGVTIGLHNQSDTAGVEKFTVLEIVKNPGWNTNTMDNDYALVKLSGDSKFAPIALNTQEISSKVDFVTAGWGTTSEGGGVSKILMKVTVPFVDKATCSAAYDGITDSMLCAGYPEGGKDSCQGDSGGPLIVGTGSSMKLAGVVSWGEGCARPNKYGVYSKVNLALDWINKTAK